MLAFRGYRRYVALMERGTAARLVDQELPFGGDAAARAPSSPPLDPIEEESEFGPLAEREPQRLHQLGYAVLAGGLALFSLAFGALGKLRHRATS